MSTYGLDLTALELCILLILFCDQRCFGLGKLCLDSLTAQVEWSRIKLSDYLTSLDKLAQYDAYLFETAGLHRTNRMQSLLDITNCCARAHGHSVR